MPYITSIERLAKKEGLNEGMEKRMEKGIRKGMKRCVERGMSKSALLVMEGQFGKLPSDLTDMTNSLTRSQLESLMRKVPKVRTIDEARRVLADLQSE